MKKNDDRAFGWEWLAMLVMAVVVYACASRGYPEGGPKDTTPPQVILEEPASFTKNFDKKRVNIYFDEFVQLKDINEKFIISPPQKKKPKPRLKGKYVQVEFVDSLKPNTTYTLDFADAISDNNEGNPLGFYRYVFSTGNEIDSLELSGQVVNAESGEPVLNVYVELYSNLADSMPLLEVPDYVARTDSSGFFRLTNLKDTIYRVVAIQDDNRDYKYTPEAEMFAYLDTLVRPVVMTMTRVDTFRVVDKIVGQDTTMRDSIVTQEYLGFGPNNLYLRLFQEKLTQLYMTDTPVGYILCSKDYQAYQARFRKSYLPLIQARSILRAALALMDLRIAGRYAGQYPAHMHIDILDAYQRMGIGHQLVNTLTASLAGQTTRGLMLSVGSTNKKGVNFYKKYGFQRIGTAAFGSIVVMGLRLS